MNARKTHRTSTRLIFTALAAIATGCSAEGGADPLTDPELGGTTGSGGIATAAGGSFAAGGTTPYTSGGGAGTGGTTTAGGSPGSSGGVPGGAGSSGSGGANAGGSGALETGGTSSGGVGGSDPADTGGTPGSGGMDTGGAGGSAGCPSALVGWAAVSGDGVSSTTGGGDAAPVRPRTADELQGYASDSTRRVIEIEGTFDVPRLQVNSNKTLVGIGKDATINGGVRIRGNKDAPVTNVIVRNLRVNGATTDADDDAMQIYYAHHVWIDHSEIWDGPDGNLDMTHAINWVTVSWTKFRYTSNYKRPAGESADHRFSNLLGHSDSNSSEDAGRIKVSFHHDWWAEGVLERMPRVRFGQVHVFNNYFSSTGNNYCVRAGLNAALLVEGNYFDHVNSAHQFNSTDDEKTASITARDNVYDGTTGTPEDGGGGPAFTSAPYTATIEPAQGVRAIVRACAGPR